MTKFQLGLLIGFFLGALVIFVTLGIIQMYLAEKHERRNRGMNRYPLRPADDSSTFYSAPFTKSCLVPEPHSPTVLNTAAEEEERVIYLFVIIE
jgi:hypothetical protein